MKKKEKNEVKIVWAVESRDLDESEWHVVRVLTPVLQQAIYNTRQDAIRMKEKWEESLGENIFKIQYRVSRMEIRRVPR